MSNWEQKKEKSNQLLGLVGKRFAWQPPTLRLEWNFLRFAWNLHGICQFSALIFLPAGRHRCKRSVEALAASMLAGRDPCSRSIEASAITSHFNPPASSNVLQFQILHCGLIPPSPLGYEASCLPSPPLGTTRTLYFCHQFSQTAAGSTVRIICQWATALSRCSASNSLVCPRLRVLRTSTPTAGLLSKISASISCFGDR